MERDSGLIVSLTTLLRLDSRYQPTKPQTNEVLPSLSPILVYPMTFVTDFKILPVWPRPGSLLEHFIEFWNFGFLNNWTLSSIQFYMYTISFPFIPVLYLSTYS